MRDLIRKIESEILRIKSHTALLNLQTALRRYALAQRKANFNPAQPRNQIGRWTAEGGHPDKPRVLPASGRVPKIPQRRPPTTKEQNRAARELAREEGIGGLAAAIVLGAVWLKDFTAVYGASFDSPKTLAKLQEAAS